MRAKGEVKVLPSLSIRAWHVHWDRDEGRDPTQLPAALDNSIWKKLTHSQNSPTPKQPPWNHSTHPPQSNSLNPDTLCPVLTFSLVVQSCSEITGKLSFIRDLSTNSFYFHCPLVSAESLSRLLSIPWTPHPSFLSFSLNSSFLVFPPTDLLLEKAKKSQ